MLVQCLRRRANIEPTLIYCLVFGFLIASSVSYSVPGSARSKTVIDGTSTQKAPRYGSSGGGGISWRPHFKS